MDDTTTTEPRRRGRPRLPAGERRVNLPGARVTGALLDEITSTLRPGESLTAFIEAASRAEVERRRQER